MLQNVTVNSEILQSELNDFEHVITELLAGGMSHLVL